MCMANIPADVQKELLRLTDAKNKIIDLIKDCKENGQVENAKKLIDRYNQVERKYRILRGEYDVLYFAYEYFSEERNPENDNNLIPKGTFFADAPDFHKILCGKLDELNEKPTKKICWSVPRGHAKSGYMSNVFPVHQISYKKRHYIIIVSETGGMSRAFVDWVNGQLKYNKKLREDFGEVLSPNKMMNELDNQDAFITHTGIKVQASSIGSQLRGSRNGAYRPDLVILDDLESSKNTNTPELRLKNEMWFNSVIMPIGDITKTSFIYMGTLVHGQGLLPHVLQRADFDGRIYSAIVSEPERMDLWQRFDEILRDTENPNRDFDADAFYYANQEEMDKGARTLWNERFTYKELMKIKVNVGSKAFSSEYLNLPSDADSCIFKSEYFVFYPELEIDYRKLDIYSFWDIAIGKNSRSDYNAIVTVGRDRITGVIYVLDAWAEKIPMHKALQVALRKIRQWKPKVFGVETVQAQYDMYRQLRENCIKEGIYSTRVLAVNPKGKKEERIEALEPLVEGGYIRFNKGHRLLLEQMELFPAHDNDDLPDALASAIEIAGKQRKRTYYQKPKGF